MRGNVFEGGHTRPRFTDLSTACGQFGNNKRLALAIGAALLAGAFSFMPAAEAEPLAGALPVLDTKGAAVTIATSGSTMNIASAETNNLIRWVDFSVGKDATVDFHDKNYLNYVTGSARSEIFGALKGTGNIYVVNPNGILIGDGASVNVGSLYLSTKDLRDNQSNPPASYSAAMAKFASASTTSVQWTVSPAGRRGYSRKLIFLELPWISSVDFCPPFDGRTFLREHFAGILFFLANTLRKANI